MNQGAGPESGSPRHRLCSVFLSGMVSSYRDCYFIAFAGFIFDNLGKKLLGVFLVLFWSLFVCVCVYFWLFLPLAWRLFTSKSFSRLFGFFCLNCFGSFFPLV